MQSALQKYKIYLYFALWNGFFMIFFIKNLWIIELLFLNNGLILILKRVIEVIDNKTILAYRSQYLIVLELLVLLRKV